VSCAELNNRTVIVKLEKHSSDNSLSLTGGDNRLVMYGMRSQPLGCSASTGGDNRLSLTSGDNRFH
jgi:hypothetical protein